MLLLPVADPLHHCFPHCIPPLRAQNPDDWWDILSSFPQRIVRLKSTDPGGTLLRYTILLLQSYSITIHSQGWPLAYDIHMSKYSPVSTLAIFSPTGTILCSIDMRLPWVPSFNHHCGCHKYRLLPKLEDQWLSIPWPIMSVYVTLTLHTHLSSLAWSGKPRSVQVWYLICPHRWEQTTASH